MGCCRAVSPVSILKFVASGFFFLWPFFSFAVCRFPGRGGFLPQALLFY